MHAIALDRLDSVTGGQAMGEKGFSRQLQRSLEERHRERAYPPPRPSRRRKA